MQVKDNKFDELRAAWLALPSVCVARDGEGEVMQRICSAVSAIVGVDAPIGDTADMIDDRELVEAGVRIRPIPTTMRMTSRGVDAADHAPFVRVRIGSSAELDVSPDDARRIANALVRAACRAEVSR